MYLLIAAADIVIGQIIFMPVKLIVTFLHEFGHASMAVLTGGTVHSLQVNFDGSGATVTSGGIQSFILAGGYIGSIFFSNLFVRLSLTDYVRPFFVAVALVTILCSIVWFSTMINFVILLLFALFCVGISMTPASTIVLQLIGVASTIEVLMDFEVGPSSDLAAFEQTVGVMPYTGWMYTWLAIAAVITIVNIKQIVRGRVKE